MSDTIRLTVGQAVVKFLANQYSERDGEEQRLIPGVFGIFGHGNVAGLGQGLLQDELGEMPLLADETRDRLEKSRPPLVVRIKKRHEITLCFLDSSIPRH